MTEPTTPPTDEDVVADASADSPTDTAGAPGADGADGATDAAPAGDSVEALQGEAEQLRGQLQRALADYQNLQRRSREERAELTRLTLGDAVRSFLPVLDDLERALDAAEHEAESAGSWLDGIRLVTQKFRGVLQHYGVEEMQALGQPFDPNHHEAVGATAGPDGQVVQLLQRGYMLNDRVLRPAMVMVGNGDEAPGTAPAGGSGETTA